MISVSYLPQNQKYVPFIRIAGEWLLSFGFGREDKVLIKAENERIVIEKVKPQI
ncbi:type I toxin-antitoxin system SymE family toxin [bacterium]|nr:type I toxin-antitoxin system SymE family toxin [bacterium]